MIDLHIHLLPGLDDGAQTWSEALRMASMAVHSGTFAIAATPHSNMPGFFETIWDARYRRRIQHLRELLEEQDIPLRVVEELSLIHISRGFKSLLLRQVKSRILRNQNTAFFGIIDFLLDIYFVTVTLAEPGHILRFRFGFFFCFRSRFGWIAYENSEKRSAI